MSHLISHLYYTSEDVRVKSWSPEQSHVLGYCRNIYFKFIFMPIDPFKLHIGPFTKKKIAPVAGRPATVYLPLTIRCDSDAAEASLQQLQVTHCGELHQARFVSVLYAVTCRESSCLAAFSVSPHHLLGVSPHHAQFTGVIFISWPLELNLVWHEIRCQVSGYWALPYGNCYF